MLRRAHRATLRFKPIKPLITRLMPQTPRGVQAQRRIARCRSIRQRRRRRLRRLIRRRLRSRPGLASVDHPLDGTGGEGQRDQLVGDHLEVLRLCTTINGISLPGSPSDLRPARVLAISALGLRLQPLMASSASGDSRLRTDQVLSAQTPHHWRSPSSRPAELSNPRQFSRELERDALDPLGRAVDEAPDQTRHSLPPSLGRWSGSHRSSQPGLLLPRRPDPPAGALPRGSAVVLSYVASADSRSAPPAPRRSAGTRRVRAE